MQDLIKRVESITEKVIIKDTKLTNLYQFLDSLGVTTDEIDKVANGTMDDIDRTFLASSIEDGEKLLKPFSFYVDFISTHVTVNATNEEEAHALAYLKVNEQISEYQDSFELNIDEVSYSRDGGDYNENI